MSEVDKMKKEDSTNADSTSNGDADDDVECIYTDKIPYSLVSLEHSRFFSHYYKV